MAIDTAIELWQSFAKFLTVELEFDDPPNVAAVVSNMAPRDSKGPAIVFEDVRLTVTGGNAQRSSNIPTLQPGVSHRVEITAPDTAGVSVEVHGRVSHRQFFSVRSQAEPPVELTSPVVQEYLERLEASRFLDKFELGRKSLAAVGPDTTLSELDKLSGDLDETDEAIRAYGKSVRCQVTIAQEAITKTMAEYLKSLAANVRRASEASQKGDSRTLLECRDAVSELEPPYGALSATFSELRNRFEIRE